jgi:hypothetical protein
LLCDFPSIDSFFLLYLLDSHAAVHGAFPKDLSDTVFFDERNIELLRQRIAALSEEKSQQRKEYKEIKQTQVPLLPASIPVFNSCFPLVCRPLAHYCRPR